MQQQPLISVIIPCYNYAHYLVECFSNLQKQAYANWECILVDNNSTDSTKQVVEDYIKKDSRIKYFFQPIKGPSAARNLGIKESKGDFIQFLDADDLLQADKLKSALAIFESKPDVDIVYSDMRYFSDKSPHEYFYSYSLNKQEDHKWMSYVSGKRKQILPTLLKENIMVISSPLIKKTSLLEIGLFNEELAYNEDWDLWLRFVLADKRICYDDNQNALSLIRVHENSHSRNRYKMYYCGLYVCCRVLKELKPSEIDKNFIKKIEYHKFVIFKKLLTLPKNELISEFEKIVNLIGQYKVIYKIIKNAPLFIVKPIISSIIFIRNIKFKFL